ncbi:13E12 repeat family protein, partial [Mycobacterium sp. GA-2829]|uniref:13E12 repeat family protein n=1 Tax=Mycobacterium sp. GA-2829 TaxID=1772283 RepID=UPI0007401F01
MDGQTVVAAFGTAVDDLVAAAAELQAASVDGLTPAQALAEFDRIKTALWALPAVEHRLTSRVMEAAPNDFGATSHKQLLANTLRVSLREAGERLADTRQLGPRHTLTGQFVRPELPHTAAAVAEGAIGTAHVRIIQDFIKKLPTWVSFARRDDYERDLVGHARVLRPDQFRKVAEALMGFIDQDGTEPDHDTMQRRREFTLGRQQADGMSRITGYITPEARAYLEVALEKYGAPGVNMPHDDAVVAEVSGRDERTTGQRHHDALTTALRLAIESGAMGQLAGVPATIVANASLADLERGTGWAFTGGGSRLPIRDLIRMAGKSRHYLAIFDDHHEEVLYFGRARRCATTAQRLALFARDHGCTHPQCTVPFYGTEAHHTDDFAAGNGQTNINTMALACHPDNLLIANTGYTTERPGDGRTYWIPPADQDTGQPR